MSGGACRLRLALRSSNSCSRTRGEQTLRCRLGATLAGARQLRQGETDAATFLACAQLNHRKTDTVDEHAMIAATAKIHGLTVVARNVADFKAFGVSLLNPLWA